MTGIGRGFPFARVPCTDRLQEVAATIDLFPGISRVPALLFVILADGRTKTDEFVMARMDEVLGARASEKSVNSAAKRLRPFLANSAFELVRTNGVGYRLIAPPGWKSQWEKRNEA